jgi:polyisoprenoid-binding protein YceI
MTTNLIVGSKLVVRDSSDKLMKKSTVIIIFALLLCMVKPAFGGSETRSIDSAHSTLTVYVYKTGLLSGLGHNHEIEAPIESGEISDSENSSVELRVKSGELRVLDTEISGDTRAKIQTTMLSAEVLDVGHFPEIHFRSTKVEPTGTDRWVIHGNLGLHGQTHPISFEVALKDGVYTGSTMLKQSDFGITPAKVAGGAVKVKDEIKVAFSIALAK